jgi:hypothetical protein
MTSQAVATSPGRRSDADPRGSILTSVPSAVRHGGPLDRVALHLGVALIRWGRRPVKAELARRAAGRAETDEALRTMEGVHDQSLAMNMTRFR